VFSGSLGFSLAEPGLDAFGPAINRVPDATKGVEAYSRWRNEVEQELADRIARGALKIWIPVRLPRQRVVPFFGGGPRSDWREAVATVAHLASQEDCSVRVIDLTTQLVGLLDRDLQGFEGDLASAVLAPGGTLDPLGHLADLDQAVGVLADIARADDERTGRNAAASAENLLQMVLRCLQPASASSLGRIRAAVECALHARTSGSNRLDPAEESAILNGPYARLQNNQPLWNQLFELDGMLAQLERFAPSAGPAWKRGSRGRGRISVLQLGQISGTARELGSDLLTSRIVHDLGARPADITMLLGADQVPSRRLDAMSRAADASAGTLMLFFERLSGSAEDRLGWGGGSVAGFFRLANHLDAERAAAFLGRQHRFVLSGWSEGRSRSSEWGWSVSTTSGTDRSTSRAWGIAGGFSRTTSHAVSHSSSQGRSGGGSLTASRSVNHERVYEYLVEPAVFQGLGDAAVLIVDTASRHARLATLSRSVANSCLVDWDSYLEVSDE
jgi:hypothetical protein